MAVLQGAFDESIGDGVFVLAGYVAPAENWMRFSDEWSDALITFTNGRRFKMKEASEWSDELRKERLGYLHNLIVRHAKFGVAVAVEPKILARVMENAPDPRMRRPHFFLFFILIQQLMTARSEWIGGDRIQFIFDRGGADQKAIEAEWDEFVHSAPEAHKQRIVNKLDFWDDEDWLPLQAADFKAWWLRRRIVEEKVGLNRKEASWPIINNIQNLVMHFDERKLVELRNAWFRNMQDCGPTITTNDGGLSIQFGGMRITFGPLG